MLKPRQQRFVELVASGRPAGRAYEEAGYSARGNVADSCAERLMRKDEIVAALAEIRAKQEHDGFLTRKDIRRMRWEMVNDPETPAAVKAKLLADEAKMMGYDEPERHSHTAEIRVVIGGNA